MYFSEAKPKKRRKSKVEDGAKELKKKKRKEIKLSDETPEEVSVEVHLEEEEDKETKLEDLNNLQETLLKETILEKATGM